MKKIYLFLLSFLFGTSIGTQAQLLEKIRNYAKAGSIFSESKQISSKRKAPMANDISFHCDYADCTNAIEYNYLANANGNYCNELVIVAKNSDNQGFQLVFTRPNDNLVGYYEGGECSEIECPYPDTYGLYLATYSNRLWRCPGAPAVCCYNTSGSNVVGVYSYILDGNGNKINIRRGSITVEENNVGGVFMETSGVTNYNNAGQSIYFTFGNRTENHLDYGEGVMYHNGKVLDISNDLNNSYNKTHLTINTSDITGSFTKEDFDLTKTAVYFKGSAVTISKISATVSFSDGVYTLNATIRDDKENVYFLKMMPRLGTMLTENIDMTDNTGLLADQYFQMTGSANGYDMTLGINATSIVGDFTLANVNIAKTSITKDGMELNLSSASISVSYDHNYYHLGLSFVDNDNNTHYLTAFYSVCATDPTPDASWGSFSSDKGDKVKFDELSDNGDVYIWAYDEDHFFRVRASSSRRETQNYVTLCFFTPDGQQYADGFGPKAGTYKVETLDVYEYQGYYYWCFQNESNVDYGSALPGYAYHTSLGVCRFGSYGGNIDKDGYVNEIMGMEGATVTVAPGKDGNIYIKIGNDITTALTIGSAVQLHKIDTYVIGEGTVLLDGECPYNVGDKVELIPTPATGYTFAYWQGVDASSIVEEDGRYYITVEDKDYSVIAVFEEAEDTYTLTWDFNGGVTTSQDNEYTHGKIPKEEFIKAPADPTRDGFEFAGWLNSVTGQIEFAEGGYMSLMPDEDLIYTAQWTANACSYTVHFDSNGGSGTMTDQEFTCGVADNLIPNEFIGPAATITYNYHGATSGDETPSVTVNKPFGVWEDNVVDELHDDEEEINYSVSNGATVTMTAQWDGFSGVILPTPEKTGYIFNGWYTEETGGTLKGEGGADYVPAGDITLHAQWTANTYTVHFDSNHGEAADEMGDQTFTYDVEQALTTNGYDWTGHTFQGWATEENGDVVYTDQQTVINLTAENNATVNLYAVWETNNYTITFQNTEVDGGNVWWSSNFAYGETLVYGGTEMPTKAGDSQYSYEFAGWKDVDGVEHPMGTDLPAVTAEATYYAVYNQTVLQYTLTWDVNDGDALTGDYTQGDVEWGTAIIAPEDPTKEGYQFAGWLSSITNEVETPSVMPAADLTYTAQWTANTYTVHFDSNHGEAADEMGDQTFTYDVEQALTANGFDWTGHTFLGWATEENGDVVYTDQETVINLTTENDATVNLYAVWETNNYTITFQDTEADGGNVWWSGDFAYGETPVYGGENEPSKESTDEHTYTFTGWTDGVNEYPVGTALPEVTDNAIYYAVYSESDALFTVRFENPDGSELQTYQLPLGATPAYEGTPAQENEGDAYNYYMFTFTGWVDSNDNSYGTDDALPAVTGDITYTAQYSKQLFIILQEQKDDDYYTEFSEKYNGERATTATLNRQFAQGKWATMCLPFNVPKALMTAVGLQNRVYEFKYTKGDAATGITLYFALASKMEAGKGYIVNANAALAQKTQLVFYSVLVDTKADIQSGYDISALSGYNSEGNIYLVGTLRRGVLYGDQGNGNYYLGLSNNKIFAANSTTGTNVLAYRGIFRSTEPISAPRVRIVAEGEDGEIVGELEVVNGELEEVTAPKKYVQDGILYIERDGIRYSAQGQRLD